MTKRDFKVRRSVFKESRFKQHRNFNQFREVYRERRRREWRMKVAVALAVLALLITLLFTVSAEPAPQRTPQAAPADPTELKIKYANQKL